MSNKNTIIATVNHFRQAFEGFIKADRLLTDSTDKATFDTNANKRITLYNRILHLLSVAPATVKFETESTATGKYNIGTLVECLLNGIEDDFKKDFYGKAVHGADIRIGNKTYEIKAGLTSYSKPTPCKADTKGKYRATILVNSQGVWLINASDVEHYLDKKGCLPYNQVCGRPYKKFEQALGYRD